MTGLPKLPGFEFRDPTVTKYHVSHEFDIINGYRFLHPTNFGVGGKQLDANSVAYITNQDPIKFDPSLTYGRVRGTTLPQFLPHFAQYDQKCLTFKAFFKQSVVDSPDEHFRIRHVNIIYFLENDTITVMEPPVMNSGFKQGRLVRRSKIPKNENGDTWHWKDFNIGIDICFNGIVYHTVDCDTFTREYMASQGIVLNATEDLPPDPYIQNRAFKSAQITRKTPPADDKLRRFLEYNGKILKFNAVWDNRDENNKDLKEYILLYFLADDTISVKEVHKPNDGCDPCPLLLRKTKLPKNWTDRPETYPSCCLELSDAEVTEYYQPKDLKIGETIFVLGRRFLLYDCDNFTRNYFQNILHIQQSAPIVVFEEPKPFIPKRIPPHEGLAIGSLEDSMQNCFQTIPTRPRKDEVRMILNASKNLRYTMELDWVHPEDSIRQFLLLYSLAYGTIQIHELQLQNSGIVGGKFLRNMHISKPNTDPMNPEFYTPADFYIGAKIEVFGHRFIITGADLYVYRYMQANLEKFQQEVVDNLRDYMYKKGFLTEDIKERQLENEERRYRKSIDKIGKELEVIKTEREKCIEMYENQRKEGSKNMTNVMKQPEPTLHSETHAIKNAHGIKPLNMECAYPIKIGEMPSSECKEGQYESDTYAVKYPETKEQKLKKYYDDVLRRHEEACMKAAEHKKYHECLPGTVFNEKDSKELSDKVLVSSLAKPQMSKYNPCKKTIRFDVPLDKCDQSKEDICNLKVDKNHCGCTN